MTDVATSTKRSRTVGEPSMYLRLSKTGLRAGTARTFLKMVASGCAVVTRVSHWDNCSLWASSGLRGSADEYLPQGAIDALLRQCLLERTDDDDRLVVTNDADIIAELIFHVFVIQNVKGKNYCNYSRYLERRGHNIAAVIIRRQLILYPGNWLFCILDDDYHGAIPDADDPDTEAERIAAELASRPCAYCGQPFPAVKHNQVTCSFACRMEWNAHRAREKRRRYQQNNRAILRAVRELGLVQQGDLK